MIWLEHPSIVYLIDSSPCGLLCCTYTCLCVTEINQTLEDLSEINTYKLVMATTVRLV